MKMLYAKLLELKEQEKQQKINELKGEQMDIAWGKPNPFLRFLPLHVG